MAKTKTPTAAEQKAAEQEKTQAQTTAATAPAQTGDQSTPGAADPKTTGTESPLDNSTPPADSASNEPTAEEQALKPIIDSMGTETNARAKIDAALGNLGVEPAPTMVNGQYVGDKTYNPETDTWEHDPSKAQAVRAEDIFDRIGNAFPFEAQRLVIEELARAVGMTADSTVDLPDGMPTLGKSTASLRTDVTGYGAYAGGKETAGPMPVAVGTDGKSQLDDADLDDGK